MRRHTFSAVFVIFFVFAIFSASMVSAYWVEFKPGTCAVGPPPNCVIGHWYWVEPGGGTSSVAGLSSAHTGSFHGHNIHESTIEERPSEVSCVLEHERYDINGATGSANAIALGYQYITDGGTAFGLFGTYDRSSDDVLGGDREVLVGNLYFQLQSSDYARTTFNFSYNQISADGVDDTGAYGAALNYTYNRYWSHASFLLGFGLQLTKAILPDGVDSDDQSDLSAAGSLGIGLGFIFTERFSMNLELFNSVGVDLQQLEDELGEETEDGTENDYQLVQVGGAYFNYLFTDFWGLTLGYKKLFGLDTYEGSEISLGSSFRF